MERVDYDAVVVGSGPNGLAAAITLQREGRSVLLIESKDTLGGGMRSAELTLPGYLHDICSAVHPMAMASPFFQSLPLYEHGLKFISPPVLAAHPFDNGQAAVLLHSLQKTADLLNEDKEGYLCIYKPLLHDWQDIAANILGPLRIPHHPVSLAKFGIKAFTSASSLANKFHSTKARGLFAGVAAHSMQSLTKSPTAAIGLVLSAVGHMDGWPIPIGGSQSIANALESYFLSLGGKITTDFHIKSLKQLPPSNVVLLDITPRQLLEIAGDQFSSFYRWQLSRYRYGMGVFKIDWALNGPLPFTASECHEAGTIHLGGTLEEIVESEDAVSQGRHPQHPFVLLTQSSRFDPTRAPEGKHVAWAYCHVPHGSQIDMTTAIENQVERFAPGFRDLIMARHTMNTVAIETYNANYIGGDINGGSLDLRQLFFRPSLKFSPYRTSAKGVYICSSSTPPGGGVHGMCGYHAAQQALQDIFNH